MKGFYSVREVADRWECSPSIVLKMIEAGELPAFRLGTRQWRVQVEAVDQYESVPADFSKREPCDVYVIRCHDFVKIGKASDPAKRIAAIQTGNPYEVTAVAVLTDGDGHKLERELHQRFAEYRHRGEWFRLEGEVLQWVQELQAQAA